MSDEALQRERYAESELERRKRGFDRFLLFSDAVVAIAITLLILPVVERASEIGDEDLTIPTIFHEIGWHIFGFLLSFVMIAVLWMRHQTVFANVQTTNRALMWANLGWLLAVIFMAFTTALTALHGSEAIAAPIYIANVAFASLMLSIAVTILNRDKSLLFPGTPEENLHLRGSWLATGLMVVALIVSLLFPAINYFAMFALFLQRPLGRRYASMQDFD